MARAGPLPDRDRGRGIGVAAAGVALLVGGTAGMLAGAEPFATWYYPFAWYGVLLATEGALRAATGRFYLLARPGFAAAALAWSVPFWLTFELLNFRVRNWYYVFVPDDPLARWLGITISFATVMPAVLLAQRILEAGSVFQGVRTRPRSVPERLPVALQWLAAAMIAGALAWPRYLYPLVWGALTLLVDPWVYRRDPERSLLGRLADGRPALPLRLLAGGLAIGFLWEMFNWGARGKWIYTVPGLEELKLFEMPVAGFLGFPVLALDAWAVWQALVLAGVAADEPAAGSIPAGPDRVEAGGGIGGRVQAGRVVAVAPAAILFSAAVLAVMDARTITSYTARLGDIAGAAAPRLAAAGHDVFSLAAAEPAEVARLAGAPADSAEAWVETARLSALRGIGTRNALALRDAGVRTVEELAAADPDDLARRLGGVPAVTPERVDVWVRAAARGRSE